MRVLVVEDDATTASFILKALAEHGHTADHAAEGREGLFLATGRQYDVLVVDRLLPELDGLAVVQALRAAKVETPVLFLSALSHVDERIKGLRAGGDDYLAKPFAFAELLARLEVLARRGGSTQVATKLQVGELVLDLLDRRVTRGGRLIELHPTEFRLLEYMMRQAGRVLTRTMLLEGVWNYHFDPRTNVIDVHVSRLRQKIDKGFATPMIRTVRGAGYSLRAGD
jgi:two-component system OmpR family response regulator